MSRFAIAAMQIEVSTAGKNFKRMADSIEHVMLVFPWVQMVVFSELAVSGPAAAFAEALPGPTEAAFQAIAKRHKIWLIPGSAHERAADGIYNTATVIDPAGNVVLRYRKMFPFFPYGVAKPGVDFAIFDVPNVGRFGLSICYDIWFPETSRTLACMGAEVLIHPTMTGTMDRDVELSIVRSTAAVNQMYVIDVNGIDGGGVGRSLIVGPEGNIIHEGGSGTEFLPIEIDLELVRRTRERGLRTLGQPLKGFRDAPVQFHVYNPASPLRAGLAHLGPLVKPGRPGVL
jgi:predicted amidohydrolase